MPRPGFPADIGLRREPQSVSAGFTPLNPAAHTLPTAPAESVRWKTLLDALLPQRPIELSKQSDMVRLTRSFEPDEDGSAAPIWTKTYQKTGPGDAAQIDLSVFNAWERTLIMKAHEDGLESCYRLYQLYEKGSGLHFGDTPVELRKSRSTVIKTHHAGPDLDQWRLMRPWCKGAMLEHPFVLQQHFLKLVRGILVALHGFHSKRFVHCDLHPGNIVLPAEVRQLPAAHGEGERYELVALWDQVKLIDLGYSVHKGIESPAMPPLALWELEDRQTLSRRDAAGNRIASRRMSPHLHGRLQTLDAIAATWPAAERYSRRHWEKHQQQLDTLRSLDWREDLYQLGYWLGRIRDGDTDGSWGAVHYMGDPVDVRDVNEFIRDFPQALMDWGTCPDLPAMPHVGYIQHIDALLALLPAASDSFVLHRREHDTAYKTYLDVLAHCPAPGQDNAQPRTPEPSETPAHKQPPTPDEAAWNHVCILDTAAAYAHYLRVWPQGTWAQEAHIRREKCVADEALPSTVARTRSAARGPALALMGLVGVLALGWAGWTYWPASIRAAPPVALAARAISEPPQAAAPAAPATAKPAATTAPDPAPVAQPSPAPVPAVEDGMVRLVNYKARTAEVESSEWWRNGRSRGLVADTGQAAWVRDTLAHATQDHWPRAQFALAGLYCSGAHPQLVPLSTGDCGAWLAKALLNPLLRSAATPPDERRRMVDGVVAEFDDLVFGYWQGSFRNSAPDAAFAQGLLVGLQALQDVYPGLALRAAHVQACYMKPAQRAAARQTLQALVAQHPGSQEAGQARRWLSQSRTGDYGHCRSARP